MPEHTPAPTFARSLYGFFMYVVCRLLLIIYCAWAFLPESILHYFNIYYYPLKYWAYVVPIQLLLAFTLCAFVMCPSLNLMLTVDIDDPRTITDQYTIEHSEDKESLEISSEACVCRNKQKCIKDVYSMAPNNEETIIPHVKDLNIRMVCKKMYH